MDTGRYEFVKVGYKQGVMVSVFYDRINLVYVAYAINIDDLDNLGGFDGPDAAMNDAIRELHNEAFKR